MPIRKRTAEIIAVGDEAWVSFDGKVSLPARVVSVDDTHYTVGFECYSPRYCVDRHHKVSLFLDEVRTTPLLACVNMVTL